MAQDTQGFNFNPPLTAAQLQEVEEARADTHQTLRPTSAALEALLFRPISVLDKGFIRVVDYMGDDSAVVQGARVSYGRGTKHVSSDRGLIRYLLRHRHTTPFELCTIKIHAKVPIFVTRQWFRHRTASINEYSARYSVLDNEFYFPAEDQVCAQSTSNRQGRGGAMEPEAAQRVIDTLKADATQSYQSYQWMLNEDDDGNVLDADRPSVAREIARINLPTNIYTQFYWQVNLWNLLHFLNLRADSHAQFEIREYANCLMAILKAWLPTVHEAFSDYVSDASTLSRQGLALVRAALTDSGPLDAKQYGLSDREVRELVELFPEISERLTPQ